MDTMFFLHLYPPLYIMSTTWGQCVRTSNDDKLPEAVCEPCAYTLGMNTLLNKIRLLFPLRNDALCPRTHDVFVCIYMCIYVCGTRESVSASADDTCAEFRIPLYLCVCISRVCTNRIGSEKISVWSNGGNTTKRISPCVHVVVCLFFPSSRGRNLSLR